MSESEDEEEGTTTGESVKKVFNDSNDIKVKSGNDEASIKELKK
jgi:hypothetical protein